MKTIIYSFLIAITTIISSCKVSKDLAVPDTSIVPASYQASFGKADTGTSMASIPWQAFFANQDLQQLIDSTLHHNFDMLIALKNIEAAQLAARQTKLNYFPEVKMLLSGAINRPSDNSLTGLSLGQFLGKSYVEDYSGNIGVSWEADIWGKIKNQRSKALLGYLQTQEAQKAIQTDLVANVAKGYYRLLMLDAQIMIAKKNLALNDSILQIIQLQYTSGQVTQLAVQQATAQQLAASELIPQLEKEIKLEEHYLSILSGIAPGAITRSGHVDEQLYKGSIQTGLPAALLANRPDVKAKELGIQMANANTSIARASMYPSLTIGINGGINSFLASNWFTMPASLFATGVAGISQPLFQQGKLKTNYKIAQIEGEKSVIAFRQTVLQAVREVSDALISIEKLMTQKKLAEQRVQTLQRSIQDAKQLFSQGMANYLEVITAQGNVLAGELSVAVLQQQQSAALIDLYRSLGGGWYK